MNTYVKALIRLGFACNNRCGFCHSSDARFSASVPDLDTTECKKRIDAARDTGAGTVVFSGGEPTIRKDLPELFEYAAGLGLKCGLVSNGRMLSSGEFTDRLVPSGLSYALISLHGDSPEIHDELAGAESFRQTVKGISKLAQAGVDLTVNTVLNRLNANSLPGIAQILTRFAPVKFKISLPEPRGAVLENFDIVLPPAEAGKAVNRLVERADAYPGVFICADGFTPCLLDDYFVRADDFFTHGIYFIMNPADEKFFAPDHGDRSFLDSCLHCSWYHLCSGIYSAYLEKFGGGWLEPVPAVVSNSVRMDRSKDSSNLSGFSNISIVSEISSVSGSSCDALLGANVDPVRYAAVARGENIELFHTDEKFTTHDELLSLKFNVQQVYFSGESQGAGLYFPTDLKKLQLTEKCARCEKQRACPGLFELSGKDVFADAIEYTREVIGGLEGRVFEAGHGGGPYSEIISDLLQKGKISHYVATDPGHSAAHSQAGSENNNSLFSHEEKTQFFKSRLEDFEWNGAPFDAALLLRSYNHLEDLEAALKKLHSLLRPGGKLVLSEDIRFLVMHGEPEEPGAGRPADNKSGESHFQHFRNHTSGAVQMLLEISGFDVESTRDAGPATAGYWLIVARKGGKEF